jgi:hypothetical protein
MCILANFTTVEIGEGRDYFQKEFRKEMDIVSHIKSMKTH